MAGFDTRGNGAGQRIESRARAVTLQRTRCALHRESFGARPRQATAGRDQHIPFKDGAMFISPPTSAMWRVSRKWMTEQSWPARWENPRTASAPMKSPAFGSLPRSRDDFATKPPAPLGRGAAQHIGQSRRRRIAPAVVQTFIGDRQISSAGGPALVDALGVRGGALSPHRNECAAGSKNIRAEKRIERAREPMLAGCAWPICTAVRDPWGRNCSPITAWNSQDRNGTIPKEREAAVHAL